MKNFFSFVLMLLVGLSLSHVVYAQDVAPAGGGGAGGDPAMTQPPSGGAGTPPSGGTPPPQGQMMPLPNDRPGMPPPSGDRSGMPPQGDRGMMPPPNDRQGPPSNDRPGMPPPNGNFPDGDRQMRNTPQDYGKMDPETRAKMEKDQRGGEGSREGFRPDSSNQPQKEMSDLFKKYGEQRQGDPSMKSFDGQGQGQGTSLRVDKALVELLCLAIGSRAAPIKTKAKGKGCPLAAADPE